MVALNFPPSPNDGDTYQGYVYDATNAVWNRIEAGLDDLADVAIANPTTGETITYDGTVWINSAAASESESLSPFLLGGM